MFPITKGLKQGNALWPLIFNFSVEYVIRGVQISEDGLSLNGTHQLAVYVDNVNMFGVSVQTIKKNTETFLVTSK